MPDRTENADDTLPRPELNPLLNPLLGENMGRWAHVYYTNPPEKREEAVLKLLHELEQETATRETAGSPQLTEAAESHEPVQPYNAALDQPATGSSLHCQSCGHENPGDQWFCGMCGTPLREAARFNGETGQTSPPNPTQLEVGQPSASGSSRPDAVPREPYEPEGQSESAFAFSKNPVEPERENLWPDRTAQPFASFLQEQEEHEPRKPYRYYVGALLAIIIIALGYVAWRNSQNNSANGELAPQAPPTTQQPALQAPAASSSAPQPTDQPAASGSSTAANTSSRPPVVNAGPAGQPAETQTSAHTTASETKKTTPVAAAGREAEPSPVQPSSSAADGSQELAVAESYLNGTNGQQRNTAEAAQWLWKAVEKRNTAATLMLSDLYLRGNGVPKNCDQAHVLLDAAATRGVREAALRLQNLRAFGCE